MHLLSLLAPLCLAGSSFAQFRPSRRDAQPSDSTSSDNVAPKRFIVEFSPDVDPAAALDSLTSNSAATVLKVFDSDVFRGASLEATEENVDSLRALDSVHQAWASRQIKLDLPKPAQLFAEGVNSTRLDIHYMTGVDKLHEAGIYGKGVTVGIVDTGIQYTHPALGGGIGPGFKVSGGYDLVGDGLWPISGNKVPDNDPLDQQGHGTHVSGIVAGKSDFFTGVAPEATLRMYKVFTSIDSTDDATLIDAFLRAYEDGCDIITSSIGGQSGWTNDPWALVASRIVEQGVVVTISAGNAGDDGPYTASSGSSGANVLAIASIDASTIVKLLLNLTFSYEDGNTYTGQYAFFTESDWTGLVDGWPVVPLTLDTTVVDDACNALPATTPDFTGKIVLVRRGTCNFSVKQANLAPFNAKYIMFYTNAQPVTTPSSTYTNSTILMVEADTGVAVVNTVKEGGSVTVAFGIVSEQSLIGVEDPYGGVASSFTSIGPTNELYIKSDVAAPGGSIFSTWPTNYWAVLSGTSMACPYVAGVAALWIGQYGGRSTHGNSFAKDLAARILSSGESVPWDDGLQLGNDYGTWASVVQVGTGLINATKVLTYDTQLSFAKFALNDTHHFSRYHRVNITNNGASPITYSFEVQDAGGMISYLTDPTAPVTPRVAFFSEAIVQPQKWVPEISLPSSFTLGPGQTKSVQVTFNNYPQGLDASQLPLYSGKILVKGSNSEILSIPYLGLGADLGKDLPSMFQYSDGVPVLVSTPDYIPISEKANYTFDLSLDAQDFPYLYEELQYATTELRWDIFEESWNERDWVYPPVVGQAGYIGSATAWAGDTSKGYFDPATDDPTYLYAFPIPYLTRDIVGLGGSSFWWLGDLANGTRIAPGKYNFRFAALVPFGTPEHSDNWDVFQTPTFEVLSLK